MEMSPVQKKQWDERESRKYLKRDTVEQRISSALGNLDTHSNRQSWAFKDGEGLGLLEGRGPSGGDSVRKRARSVKQP